MPWSGWAPSPEDVEKAKTRSGAWTKRQLEQWGIPWPPYRGWKKDLERVWREQNGKQKRVLRGTTD